MNKIPDGIYQMWHVDDVVEHWVWASSGGEVVDALVEYAGYTIEDLGKIIIKPLACEEEFTFIMDTGTEIKLSGEEWRSLLWQVREPMYFACSEW